MGLTPPTINGTISEKTQSLLTKLTTINTDYENKTKQEIEKKQKQMSAVKNLEREISVELKNILFNKAVMIKINATSEGIQNEK